MSIARNYLLAKPPGPSGPKLFLDTRVVPVAVNLAAAVEVALERASVRTGVRPSVILAGLTGALSYVLVRWLRQRTPSTSRR